MRESVAEKARYAVAGVLTTLVNLGSYWLLTAGPLDPSDPLELQVANVASWACAVAFAYAANRAYVFRSNDGRVLAEAARFVSARLASLAADMACMWLLVSVVGVGDRPAKLAVQILVFVLNYVLSRVMVFSRRQS